MTRKLSNVTYRVFVRRFEGDCLEKSRVELIALGNPHKNNQYNKRSGDVRLLLFPQRTQTL
jgi:hypothetical protein